MDNRLPGLGTHVPIFIVIYFSEAIICLDSVLNFSGGIYLSVFFFGNQNDEDSCGFCFVGSLPGGLFSNFSWEPKGEPGSLLLSKADSGKGCDFIC